MHLAADAAVTFIVGALAWLHIRLGMAEELKKYLEQFGMSAAMIAFAIVLHRELPVALHHDIDLLGHLGVAEIMREKIGLDRLLHLVDVRGRIVRKANKQNTGDVFEVHRFQTEAAAIDFMRHMLGESKRAGEIVCPVMVLADNFRG
jgi:hypothetical protein